MAYQHHDIRFAEIKPVDYYGAASRGMRDGLSAVGQGMAIKNSMDEQERLKKLNERLLEIYGDGKQTVTQQPGPEPVQTQKTLPTSEEVIRRMMGNGGRVTGGAL